MDENAVEQALLETLTGLGWHIAYGPDLESYFDGRSAERDYGDVVLAGRLIRALNRLNPGMDSEVINGVIRKLTHNSHADLIDNNYDFHRLLVNGIPVQYRLSDGLIKSDLLRVVDFDNPSNNEFLAVNQVTIVQGDYKRRPDVILYINGLPLVVIELKNPTDKDADLQMAYNQLQTYKREISDTFRFNELLVISDGLDAEIGTISSGFDRMMPWKTIDGEKEAGNVPMLDVLAGGVFDKGRLLDIVQNFIVYERGDRESIRKKVAAYHQYWAVNKALNSTLKASGVAGDGRAGVVWHTQGSGKSLSMVFYAGKLMHSYDFHNPTVVVVTDRNDLDGQLFGTFLSCSDLLGEKPRQAESRHQLRQLLSREAGGIIFTTIQKFAPDADKDAMPVLTDRRNVIVMADEAHRSQYGFKAHVRNGDNQVVYGYAKYMRDALPNASYIGFTGTPIEFADKSTPAVFGDYIDIYDVKQAVEDGATVPIYYESRLVDLGIDEATRMWLDQKADELLSDESEDRQLQLKRENAQKEAIVGNERRLEVVAGDIVGHFEARNSVMDGKGMIVTMSRRIAAELYNKIIDLRPEWHGDSIDDGVIKVVITGQAGDDEILQPHIHNKAQLKEIERRMKNPSDPLKLVIVCDMWLTGFDVPCLNVMYLDKPLKGHNLMQAIARVNRVWPGKTGGLIVDYLGVASALRDAMAEYTRSGGKGEPQMDIQQAIDKMMTCYEVVRDMFNGKLSYQQYANDTTSRRLQMILDAEDYILSLNDGANRYGQNVLELTKAYALVMPRPEALQIRDEVALYQAVKARLEKVRPTSSNISNREYKMALKQIVNEAIAPTGEVIDVFQAAGLAKPDVSILSDEFFAEVRNMRRKNLAVAALNKLLKGQIQAHFGKNVAKDEKFSQMLEAALNRYRNGSVEAAQIIEELIEIGKEIQDAKNEQNDLGLTDDEVLFYDALVENGSAKSVMGDDKLCELARVLVNQVRKDAVTDWRKFNSTKARLRVNVRKVLARYGYPPDQQRLAADRVLEQAERCSSDWSRNERTPNNNWTDNNGASLLS